ncbi:glycosyltransferase [Geomonas sp. RF6]|nr:glycosyltransferase [Geomonas sp. RF6]
MVASLPAHRYRPIMVCVGQSGPLAERVRARGITLYLRPDSIKDRWGTVSWLKAIIEKERVAVVHAHQYNPLHYSVLATLGRPEVNLVYTEHGRMYPERLNWKRYLTNRLFATRVNHLVSISSSTRLAMVRYDNLPGPRISVIHNGVEIDEVGPQFDLKEKRRALGIGEGARVIGTASRLEEIKNIPTMLRAFRRVLQAFPDCVLLVAGHGTQLERLTALATELGISERVHFLGLRSDLREIFKVIEVFLLVSFTEGISITLLEAMGSGVPTVVSRAGGNPEVVLDGVTGYLVEVEDDEALARRVVELLNDREKAARLGARGRERVIADFSFSTMMEAYLKLYQHRIEGSHEIRG